MLEIVPNVALLAIGGIGGYLLRALFSRARQVRSHRSTRWPLDVHIETDPRIIWANTPPWVSAFVFIPGTIDPAELDPPEGGALDLFKWALDEKGGMPAGFSTTQMTLRSKTNLEVIFDSVRIEAVEYDPGPGITIFRPTGGASLESRRFDIELSEFSSRVTPRELGSAEVGELSGSVKPGEPMRINLDAQPSTIFGEAKAYRWFAYVDMLIEGRRKTVRVPQKEDDFFFLVNHKHFTSYYETPEGWKKTDW